MDGEAQGTAEWHRDRHCARLCQSDLNPVILLTRDDAKWTTTDRRMRKQYSVYDWQTSALSARRDEQRVCCNA